MRAAACLAATVLGLALTGAGAQEAPAPTAPATTTDPATVPDTAAEASPKAVPVAPLAAAPDAPATVLADPASLARMRQDLAALGKALQSLRAELRASGPSGFAVAGGTRAIERMDRLEAEIARLTGEVEAMRNRVEAAITEGGKRAGDIEFRLCELDPACDLGALTTAQLDAAVTDQPAPSPSPAGMPVPAGTPRPAPQPAAPSGEAADLGRARQAASAGDHAQAAQLLAAFAADYPSSPLIPEVLYLQGEALSASGDGAAAAGAWLAAFTADPAGEFAPQALLGLADAMARTGKPEDSCLFLADVPARFPGTPAALEAVTRAEAQSCAPAVPLAGADPAATDPAAMEPEAAADLADGN